MSVPSSRDGESFYSCEPKSKKARHSEATDEKPGAPAIEEKSSARAIEEKSAAPEIEEKSTALAIMPATTQARTAADIQRIISEVDFDDVANHLDHDAGPFVVCDGVSVEAFNEYVADGEELRFALRFLDLADDGRLLIVELPSRLHESITRFFEAKFLSAMGHGDAIALGGSMTAHRVGAHDKEADASYGPREDTPNRTPPPQHRTVNDWVTLAVEAGKSQGWDSLTRTATWWAGYVGIQYILLLKVNDDATELEYRLYDIVIPGPLPDAPTANGTVRRNEAPNPGDIVSFNMRRILSIPVDQALPERVNDFADVDLRNVLNIVYGGFSHPI